MDKLEFENLGEDPQPTAPKKDKANMLKQNEAIDLSNKIIVALRYKVREFNKVNPNKKVTLNQLKKVYQRGAEMRSGDPHALSIEPTLGIGAWAMAKVNMFLRMKTGDKVAIANKDKAATRVNSYIDVSANWVPSEEDLLQANKDIEEHKLFNFNNIEELYLDEYQRMDIEY